MLIREKYLKEIRPFYDSDLIKILVGIRRCGKSTLLSQIINEIKQHTTSDHIISVNFEFIEYEHLKDILTLNNFVKDKIKDDKTYYLFFDEIQNVPNFEKVLNSLRASLNVSIFITGSNSKLLSNELSSVLSGRYVSFDIYPLTFNEIAKLNNIKDYDSALNDYLKWGGLPNRFQFQNESAIKSYLLSVYDSIILRDVVERLNIRDLKLFNLILQYVLDTIGREFSSENVIARLKQAGKDVSSATVYNYLEGLTKAFIIKKVSRYDIHGKAILKSLPKYYATDLGIASIKRHEQYVSKAYALENIVLNELIYKGYEVYIGKTNKGEIDFVAIKDGIKKYIQVAAYLEDESTIKREFSAFTCIKDSFEKYVISLSKEKFVLDGIKHINIIDFLLDKDF